MRSTSGGNSCANSCSYAAYVQKQCAVSSDRSGGQQVGALKWSAVKHEGSGGEAAYDSSRTRHSAYPPMPPPAVLTAGSEAYAAHRLPVGTPDVCSSRRLPACRASAHTLHHTFSEFRSFAVEACWVGIFSGLGRICICLLGMYENTLVRRDDDDAPDPLGRAP